MEMFDSYETLVNHLLRLFDVINHEIQLTIDMYQYYCYYVHQSLMLGLQYWNLENFYIRVLPAMS